MKLVLMRALLLSICILFYTSLTLAQNRHEVAIELYEQAREAYRSGYLESANQLLEESLQMKQTTEANYLSGLVYEAMGKDLRAVSAYEAVLTIDPDHREAIFQKALIYLNYGDPDQALKDFTYLINSGNAAETKGVYFQVDPTGNSQNSILTLATIKDQLYHYRGQCYEKLEDPDKALEDYNMAIAADSLPDYFISRGLLYSRQDKLSPALNDLKTALNLDPENQLAWYNLALLNPAVKLPDHLIRDSSFAPTLGLLASRAMEDGKYTLAKKYYDQAIVNDPKDALSYINRGRTLMKMEKYNAARSDFNTANRLEPKRAEALYLIGNSFFFQKDYDTAIAYYNQYLILDPTNGMVWYNGAMAYMEQKKYEEACHFLQKAHTLGMIQAKTLSDRYCQ